MLNSRYIKTCIIFKATSSSPTSILIIARRAFSSSAFEMRPSPSESNIRNVTSQTTQRLISGWMEGFMQELIN